MTIPRRTVLTVLALSLPAASAQAEEPSALQRSGAAIDRGARRTGEAVERGAQRTGSAVERGARRTGSALERAGNWTAERARRIGRRLGGTD